MSTSDTGLDLIDFGANSQDALISGNVQMYPGTSEPARTVPVDRLRKFEEFIEEPIDGPDKPKYWSVEFFRPFFDVTTQVVLHRLLRALQPFSSSDFFAGSPPDLYVPFWLTTTLICVLTVSANAASYLTLGAAHFSANVQILVNSASLVYGIATAVPIAIYCLLRGEGSEVKFINVLSLYGYSLLAFIPAILISALAQWLRWPAMSFATLWSFLLLRANYTAELQSQQPTKRYLTLAALAIGYLIFFLYLNLDYLKVAIPKEVKGDAAVPDTSDDSSPK